MPKSTVGLALLTWNLVCLNLRKENNEKNVCLKRNIDKNITSLTFAVSNLVVQVFISTFTCSHSKHFTGDKNKNI